MDTTYHSNIPIETLSLLDCDVRNFDFIHPIKNIFFDNIEYIRKLDASGKARPCILDNVERSLLCHTCYLGFDQFECTDCDNWNIIPHSCHSRFCNACGIKYAKQLAAKATSFCLDCPHRHIVFTIPEELRNCFRQDRSRLNLLFVAARNTICTLVNRSLLKKLKMKQLRNTHYIFKDIPVRNEFGMIATMHERPNGWYIGINNDEHLLDLAFPTDTYWNARQLYEYTQDADAACAISGAINEIYISIKNILE